MGEGPRKWVDKRWARRGRQVQFLTVSHWSPVPSSMPGMIRERKRERERERERNKRGVSNSNDRGNPQRKCNCLLHCQPMAIPASSPLNIKHKHNVHAIRHFSIRRHRPIWVSVGITTVTTTHRVIYTSL